MSYLSYFKHIQELDRQREIDRKQREEAMRLERERQLYLASREAAAQQTQQIQPPLQPIQSVQPPQLVPASQGMHLSSSSKQLSNL